MAGLFVFLFLLMTRCTDVTGFVRTSADSSTCRHVIYNVQHLHQVSHRLIAT